MYMYMHVYTKIYTYIYMYIYTDISISAKYYSTDGIIIGLSV